MEPCHLYPPSSYFTQLKESEKKPAKSENFQDYGQVNF